METLILTEVVEQSKEIVESVVNKTTGCFSGWDVEDGIFVADVSHSMLCEFMNRYGSDRYSFWFWAFDEFNIECRIFPQNPNSVEIKVFCDEKKLASGSYLSKIHKATKSTRHCVIGVNQFEEFFEKLSDAIERTISRI